MKKLLFLVLLLVVAVFALVWALTRPQKHPDLKDQPLITERSIAKIVTAIGRLRQTGKVQVRLDEDDINGLARAYFQGSLGKKAVEDAGGGGKTHAFVMDSACVKIGRGVMTVFFDLHYRGLPVYAKFRGVPTLVDRRIGFDASSMKIGAIPLPGFVANRILASALADPRYEKSLTVRKEIRDIAIDGGNIVLNLEK